MIFKMPVFESEEYSSLDERDDRELNLLPPSVGLSNGAEARFDAAPAHVFVAQNAQNDSFTMAANATLGTGLNLFDDNGSGADTDGTNALSIATVNGSAANVG